MKRCTQCQSTYTDDSLNYCLQDGTSLVDVSTNFDALPETLKLNRPLSEQSDEKGILDYSLEIEESFEEINRIVARYSEEIDSFNHKADKASKDMQILNKNPALGTAKLKHALALQIASAMNLFSRSIEEELPVFESNAKTLDEAISGLIAVARITSQNDKEKIIGARILIAETLASITEQFKSFYELQEVVRGLVNISKDMSQSRRRLVKALEGFIINLEKVKATTGRTIVMIDTKFGDELKAE
jgi:hypothetical protein